MNLYKMVLNAIHKIRFFSEENLSREIRISRLKFDLSSLIVLILIVVYSTIFSCITIERYYAFRTTGWDLGIAMQILWNTIHGKPFYYTYELNIAPSGNFLALHFAPIYLLLAPFYALLPRAETLLALQSLVLAFGALLLYLLSKKVLNSRQIAIAIATIYLLYPPLHGVNWFDFHSEAFIPLFVILLYYAIEKRNIPLFYVSLLLSWTTITLTPILVSAITFFSLIKHRKEAKLRYHLILATILSLLYFYSAYWFSNTFLRYCGEEAFELRAWSAWGQSLGEIMFNVVTRPLEALAYMVTPWTKVLYVILMLALVIFLPIFASWEFLPTLAWFVPALLSSSPPFSTYLGIYNQYPSFVIGQIFASLPYALKRLKSIKSSSNHDVCLLYVKRALIVSLIFSIFLSPLGMAGLAATYQGDSFLGFPIRTSHHEILRSVLSLIPQEASVVAQNDILPALSNREAVYGPFIPEGILPEYVVIDIKSRWSSAPVSSSPSFVEVVNKLLVSRSYGLLASADGVILYKLNYSGPIKVYEPLRMEFRCTDLLVKGGTLSIGKEKVSVYEPSKGKTFFYGPYITLPPGTYEATFTIMAQDFRSEDYIGTLDVATDKGRNLLAKLPIYGFDLSKEGWSNITLRFSLDKFYSDVEFRGINMGEKVVFLKQVTLRQVSHTTEPSPHIRISARELAVRVGEVRDGVYIHKVGDGVGGWYGPYIRLPSGKYEAMFVVKLDSASQDHVLDLDIVIDLGKVCLNKTSLYLSDFNVGQWQKFSLIFVLDRDVRDAEFRGVVVDANASLSLLLIEVRRIC
jgi:uncharacterized membrane protein